MKLPNAEQLIVERDKVVAYLLNSTHPLGASKARFFQQFGFEADQWPQLVDALREHGETHSVTSTRNTPFGPRYEVDGELNTPVGEHPRIRTVWQLDHGQVAPRLITAHPLEAES